MSKTTDTFFQNTDLTLETTTKLVQEGLQGADYGEFYQEKAEAESMSKDSGVYNVSVGNGSSGFSFRVGKGASIGFDHCAEFNEASLKASIDKARAILDVQPDSAGVAKDVVSGAHETPFYTVNNPIGGMTLKEKREAIDAIEAYAKSLDNRITNVNVSYSGGYKEVHVITADGKSLYDYRPMATLVVSVTLKNADGRVEIGNAFIGGRTECTEVFKEDAYQEAVKEALHMGNELMRAEDAPAGEMDVVIGNGWNAVLLHEAIGHGLEGDFNRRGNSVYSGKVGEVIAGPEVTVIDQGDMPGERGSTRFDDEGTPTQKNVLIENGVLKGYMQDRQNAQLMDVPLTGNGRRQDYASKPMPRMTNTYFAAGKHTKDEIIASVKDGLYVTNMAGGQVDIVSGQFNFVATLAYRIRDGKICEPVKGATLIGDGITVIKSITMVGNDLELERAAGNCGKEGQSVIVGCGQPTVRVSNMTVGGTKKR